jgi:hypothetical protein
MKPVGPVINHHVTPLLTQVTSYTLTGTSAAQEALDEPETELDLQVWLLVYHPIKDSILNSNKS